MSRPTCHLQFLCHSKRFYFWYINTNLNNSIPNQAEVAISQNLVLKINNNNIKGVYNSRVASDELGENRQKELNESFLLESVAFLSYLSHFVFSRLISGAQSCRF